MDMCTLAKLKSISCRDSLEKCFGLLFGFYIFFLCWPQEQTYLYDTHLWKEITQQKQCPQAFGG